MQCRRAFRGVARVAEVDHQSVAQSLQQMTAMGRDDFIRRLEQQFADSARRRDFVALNQPNRFDDVREHDGLVGIMQRQVERQAILLLMPTLLHPPLRPESVQANFDGAAPVLRAPAAPLHAKYAPKTKFAHYRRYG